MPIHFESNPDECYFTTRMVGRVSVKELTDYYSKVYFRPELEVLKPEFVDLSEADFGDLSIEAAREVEDVTESALKSRGAESQIVAAYVPGDVEFRLVRAYMVRALDGPENIGVFRDRDAAVNWLRG